VSVWSTIESEICLHTGGKFEHSRQRPLGGGCINSAYEISAGSETYFVKLNDADKVSMFEAEARGLGEIIQSNTVRAPGPLCWGSDNTTAFIVMEYLPLSGGNENVAVTLGRQLASMHRTTREQFGWTINNTIGSTPQINTPGDNWVEFLRRHRYGYQLELAASSGYGNKLQQKGERLLANLDLFFTDYSPQPSLLHGDLWSGNYAADDNGEPVIFDPAVYYGDREADIAMTELFGGFGSGFYAAYNENYPLDAGYSVRKTLYNLYHILNHLNLFGGGYGSQAEHMIDSLLSHIK
jgi:protein-ribulosamine 3-kinase